MTVNLGSLLDSECRCRVRILSRALLDSFVMKLSIDFNGLMVYLSLEKLEKQELQFIDQDDNTKT